MHTIQNAHNSNYLTHSKLTALWQATIRSVFICR